MTKFKAPYNKRPLRDEQWPCDDYREGDGKDPRFDKEAIQRNTPNRKAQQLCSQVLMSLNLALNESSSDLLRDVYVESVIPAPDSTQLLITLARHEGFTKTALPSPDEVLSAVQTASGWLRTEVASSISRKRVPQLKFIVK